MRPAVSHDEAFAELDAIAFDLLDTVERDAIMLHVETCAECRAELDALQETAADSAFSATPSTQMPAASRRDIRAHLIAHAAASRSSNGQIKPGTTPLLFPRTVAPTPLASATVAARRRNTAFAIAAGVLFAATLGSLAISLRGRQDVAHALEEQIAATSRLRHSVDSLSGQLAARDSLIAGVAARDVTTWTLTSATATDPYARLFWDRARHSWTLIAHNIPPLKSGRTYQLWLVTPKAKISAGTFDVHGGDAVVRATYDLTEPPRGIAVTDEPAGGVPQPTGSVVVAAQTK
ncbi:MAG: anti-sigma factor domain-containing protein [Gemmatimonadaceae bacterium]